MRVEHAERMRLAGHHRRERRFVAADGLGDRDGDVVGRQSDDGLDRVLDADRLTRSETELGRRLRRCVCRDWDT